MKLQWSHLHTLQAPTGVRVAATLQILNGKTAGTKHSLIHPNTRIGRHPDCEIQLDISAASRFHAHVMKEGDAYLIEDGKVTHPVKGATLIGNGPDSLTRVSMIGNDMKLDTGVGVCGKEGQSVPVGVGQPTLRIDGLTVGGTAA